MAKKSIINTRSAKKILVSIRQKLSPRRVAAIAGILLVVLLVRFFSNRGVTTVQATTVSRSDITEGVSISGKIDADKKADLTFQTPGKLAWVGVKKGDSVRAGQALASLETTPLDAAYEQALKTWLAREADAEAVLDSLKDHNTNETFAQKAQRTDAQALRDSAYDAVRAAEYNLRQAILISPFSGIIVNATPTSAGINVSPATAIYSVVDPSSLYFSGEITESDIAQIKEGQEVKISLDAFSDKNFESKVGKIDFASFINSTGATAYRVHIAFPKNTENLKLGMNGDAEIIISRHKNALTAPVTAIVESDGKTYVWKIVNGKATRIEVKTGVSSVDSTEITQGLAEGDKIITNPSSTLREGQAVKTS